MSSTKSWRTVHNGLLRPNTLFVAASDRIACARGHGLYRGPAARPVDAGANVRRHPGRRCAVKRGLNSAEAMEYLGMRRLAPIHYVGAVSMHAHRKQASIHGHSWTARGVDVETSVAEVDPPFPEGCPP